MIRPTAARIIATAAFTLFLVATALPVPHADARRVCQPPPPVVDAKTDLPLNLDPLYPVWPHGAVWGPYPPTQMADGGAEIGYANDCLYAQGGVLSGLGSAGGGQPDLNGDGMGDEWQAAWAKLGYILQPVVDTDNDGLVNVREFQWELIPVCVPGAGIVNCMDYERIDGDGDGWNDGPEVAYWNNPNNDAILKGEAVAFYDPDRLVDLDGDGRANTRDADSDNDTLADGVEVNTYGTYPEFTDSDCPITETACPKSQGGNYYASRPNQPGKGDGLDDRAELSAWNARGSTAWTTNFDGDGITDNLLDPDSDNDGLLDGEEFRLGAPQVRPDLPDTERDGLRDGDEVAWNVDTDRDGLVNANDPDSDNDGMPDAWEVRYSLNMVDPSDALLDRDGDQLSSLAEYQHGTDPTDMDTEGDLLLDGEEVLTWHTNPLFWDTDHDLMPDRFETDNALNPLSSADASQDPDGDSFDRDHNGVPEQAWPNLAEYRYGRASNYDEASSGPYLLGTKPKTADTDGDAAPDGYEVYYGQDPRVPANVESDDDQDGLTWSQEVDMGSDPSDPDTDNDGLCDGGRAANCHFPGLGTVGNQPGESDYGSVPWSTDSDRDALPDWFEAKRHDPGASGHDNDTDADGMGSIIDADSDNDGLLDGAEVNTYHTSEQLADTDGDQANDAIEVARWALSTTDNRRSNPLDPDTDDDGLLDGPEIDVHRTWPNNVDTDRDGLHDADEIRAGASPLLWDTDRDGLGDYDEVNGGTNPAVADADQDPDADGLANSQEVGLDSIYYFGARMNPRSADTDGDGMDDKWEYLRWKWSGLHYSDKLANPSLSPDPTRADANADGDQDGLSNLQEYNQGTDPRHADTDYDGLLDNDELVYWHSNPARYDSDGDLLPDNKACRTAYVPQAIQVCGEIQEWDRHLGGPLMSYGSNYRETDYDGDGLRFLTDPDSDDDGVDDRTEFVFLHTDPSNADTDRDTLTDWEEAFALGGKYSPRKADTDGDGIRDDAEIHADEPTSDIDQDGLTLAQEQQYGTNSQRADTDCDGIKDGPEVNYWGADWNTGANRLLTRDVDGDTLEDGLEIGAVGAPSQVLYITDPAAADTDADGLAEGQEARNNVRVTCVQGAQSMSTVPGLSLDAIERPPVLGANGLSYGLDANGVYIQGGFGVRLYLGLSGAEVEGASGLADALAGTQPMAEPGPHGLTDPTKWDTDGDGISDGDEVSGNAPGRPQNPPKPSDPTACDSDGDGLGDMLELGITGQNDPSNACTQRDTNPYNKPTDPKNPDSDGDGLLDGLEDANKDGDVDITKLLAGAADLSSGYCGTAGETDGADADTDDDGINDLAEESGTLTGIKTMPFCFDSDLDGLSDGLEQGVTSMLPDTQLRNVLGFWPTYQQWQGRTLGGVKLTSLVNDADSDDDGIIDGLEDANHNGRWGFDGPGGLHDTVNINGTVVQELNPSMQDQNQDGRPDGQDSDGDGILDGRELLILGKYTFSDVMGSWGKSFQGTIFQPANPYQTDPRLPNTDSDGILDGNDLNPRADALMAIEFGNMMFTEDDQDEELGSNFELYVNELKIDLPVTSGDYTVQIPSDKHVSVPQNIRVWQPFPSELVDKLWNPDFTTAAPTAAELGWKIARIGSSPALRVNLPDDATQLNPGDLKVKVTIDLREEDPANDDILDVNGDQAETKLVYEINLAGDLPDAPLNGGFSDANLKYLQWRDQGLPIFTGDGRKNDGDEDFNLEFHGGDSIPRTFLSRFAPGLVPDPLSGKTCFGSASCLG